MGIFSRTRDIIAANFTELLDQADDPSKMIRMIILEMEETLVEVRASAARTIADQKEMHRHTVKLEKLQAEMQAAVGMLNAGLASVLERLDSQAKAGEGYEHFLADLGRALASFQERAAETLVENALKTQEILMEVLERSEGKAANRPESEVASLT